MENLKIKVNSIEESKEAQELFFELGGDFYFGGKLYCNTHLELVTINKDGLMANIELDGFDYTEITLPELKDMVVLKRNCVEDATHEDYQKNAWLLTGGDSYMMQDGEWELRGDAPKLLKPIESESLNDKVASAEVARQEEKTALDELLELRSSDEEIKNRSAWDKQVGGLHYKDFAIQPMQFALANQLDYAQSNVIKYVTRHAQKNGKQDLLKAIHNIELMIEYYYPE